MRYWLIIIGMLFVIQPTIYALTPAEAQIVADSQNAFFFDLVKYSIAMICLLSGMRFGQEQLKL